MVVLQFLNNTARTSEPVFDGFTSGDDYGFTKTIIPVRLTQYGDDKLVSRPQTKRLLARVDKFKTVIYDFNDVGSIGQAFDYIGEPCRTRTYDQGIMSHKKVNLPQQPTTNNNNKTK